MESESEPRALAGVVMGPSYAVIAASTASRGGEPERCSLLWQQLDLLDLLDLAEGR